MSPASEDYAPWSGHVPAECRRVPVTTYRLQLGPDLGFDGAAATRAVTLTAVLTVVSSSLPAISVLNNHRQCGAYAYYRASNWSLRPSCDGWMGEHDRTVRFQGVTSIGLAYSICIFLRKVE